MRYFTANAVVGNQEFGVAEQGLSELFGSTRLLTINTTICIYFQTRNAKRNNINDYHLKKGLQSLKTSWNTQRVHRPYSRYQPTPVALISTTNTLIPIQYHQHNQSNLIESSMAWNDLHWSTWLEHQYCPMSNLCHHPPPRYRKRTARKTLLHYIHHLIPPGSASDMSQQPRLLADQRQSALTIFLALIQLYGPGQTSEYGYKPASLALAFYDYSLCGDSFLMLFFSFICHLLCSQTAGTCASDITVYLRYFDDLESWSQDKLENAKNAIEDFAEHIIQHLLLPRSFFTIRDLIPLFKLKYWFRRYQQSGFYRSTCHRPHIQLNLLRNPLQQRA